MPGSFAPQKFGQYTLMARLGRGGMADVYRARREGAAGFERTVVVKKILGGHNEDPQFVEMFINEAKIAARLAHPNIVQVFELGEQEGEFFISMEYVKGKDLLRLLRALALQTPETPAVPPLLAAHIAREVCRGLAHAHELTDEKGQPRPIVHRDVSPQNIMIAYDGQVKLVDFGIAKALDSMKEETRTGALKGKFAYMAPELIGGFSPGPQSDIFSTGIVLHEMLTGRRLFKGQNDYDTLQKVQQMEVPLPSSINPAVSPELDGIVLQALERDRERRYARAHTMARDLDVFLQAHRFAIEDMAELMARMFPPDTRDQQSEDARFIDDEPGPPGTTQPSLSHPVRTPHTGRSLPAQRDGAGSSSSATWWMGGIAAAAVLLVIAFLYPLAKQRGRTAHGPVEHPPVALPAPGPSHAATEPLPTPHAPAAVNVRLSTEPPGAQVWQGPRLVGTSPLSLRVDGDHPALITLLHAGYEDLNYTVQPGDAPELTLRLLRRRHEVHRPVAAPTPRAPGHKPRVDSVDESPSAPRVPKVTPIDD